MAYEDMTYEEILARMTDRITSQNPNIDVREGSMIFNAIAPEALELAMAYSEAINQRNETFISTATRDGKLKRCFEVGINTELFNATYGKFKGEFNIQVEIGSRWNLDLYNYTVESYLGKTEANNHEYILVCETLGTAPNGVFGDLTPITDAPSGLTYAKLTEVVIEGENEATDSEIETYYLNKVDGTATDGNVEHYKQWCATFNGIGNYKVFPLWNGNNTVKTSILSASNGVASDELVNSFQNYLDPNIEGMGNGVAPIGAFVTVSTATEVPINMTANVVLAEGYSSTELIDQALTAYFAEVAYTTAQISYMRLGAVILDAPCVDYITDLTINGGTEDIALGDEEIAILGEATWTVVEE